MADTNTNRTTGYILIGLGLAFVFLRLTGFTLMSLLWPLWVLVPGAVALATGLRSERVQLGWAIPGAVIGGTGAILMLLNLTGRWEAWSYMWALYPVFVGMTIAIAGRRNDNPSQRQAGRTVARVGLWLLVGFGLMFELLIFGGFGLLNSTLLPVLLIGSGAALVIFRDQISFDPVALFGNEKPKRKNDITLT